MTAPTSIRPTTCCRLRAGRARAGAARRRRPPYRRLRRCQREYAATAETLAVIALAAPPVEPPATCGPACSRCRGVSPASCAARRGDGRGVAATSLVPARWSRRRRGRAVPAADHAARRGRRSSPTRPARCRSRATPRASRPGRSARRRPVRLRGLGDAARRRAAGGRRDGRRHPTLADVRPGDQIGVTVEPAAGSPGRPPRPSRSRRSRSAQGRDDAVEVVAPDLLRRWRQHLVPQLAQAAEHLR